MINKLTIGISILIMGLFLGNIKSLFDLFQIITIITGLAIVVDVFVYDYK
jgi:phosphoglycerol transferase MdoB-like AlkP superfamily enzyme